MATGEPQDRPQGASAGQPETPAARANGPAANTTPSGQDAAPPGMEATPGGEAPHKRRNVWPWIAGGLAVVAAGLLIWALNLQSDVDSKDQDIAQLQEDAEQSQDRGGAVMSALKAGYDQLVGQLGAATSDLDTAVQEVEATQQASDEAAQKLEAARSDAAQAANDAAAKAEATADEARAEADAAQSKASVAGGCVKAYLSAIGSLFEGDSVRLQLPTVRDDLGRISADCKAALAGA